MCFLISQRKFSPKGWKDDDAIRELFDAVVVFKKLPAGHIVDGSEILLTS